MELFASALLSFGIGTVLAWITLVITVAVGQKVADLSVPPWPETLWKLAVVVAAANAIAVALEPIHSIVGSVASLIVFWWLMVRWFDVTFLGAIILVLISWGIRTALLLLLLGALA